MTQGNEDRAKAALSVDATAGRPAAGEGAGGPRGIDEQERRIVELEAKVAEQKVQLAEAERAIETAANGGGRLARRRLLEGRAELQQAHERAEREVARRMSLEREVERQIGRRRAERQKFDRRIAHLKEQMVREVEDARSHGDTEAGELNSALARARAEARTALAEGHAAVREARSVGDEERARRREVEGRLESITTSHAASAREAERQRRELEVLRSELERALREGARLRSELERLKTI